MKKLLFIITLLYVLNIAVIAFACYLNTSCFFRCLNTGRSVRECLNLCEEY